MGPPDKDPPAKAPEIRSKAGDAPADPQALLTTLTTEHLTLQGSRASTISESSARAVLFVGAVSSALIVLGFIAQAPRTDGVFDVFVLVVLPTIYLLGWFTFVRVVASSTEDLLYGRAINRIRHYYAELAGDRTHYLLLGSHDDAIGVLANMGIYRPLVLEPVLPQTCRRLAPEGSSSRSSTAFTF